MRMAMFAAAVFCLAGCGGDGASGTPAGGTGGSEVASAGTGGAPARGTGGAIGAGGTMASGTGGTGAASTGGHAGGTGGAPAAGTYSTCTAWPWTASTSDVGNCTADDPKTLGFYVQLKKDGHPCVTCRGMPSDAAACLAGDVCIADPNTANLECDVGALCVTSCSLCSYP